MNPLKPLMRTVIIGLPPLAILIGAALSWGRIAEGADTVQITKLPVEVKYRTFDPRRPPSDMPKLQPREAALCAAEFLSSASVSGQAAQTDPMHAKLTINRVEMTLQLNITIWLPPNPPRIIVEHEEGHRQIAEYFYDSADLIAKGLAQPYIGKVIELSGPDVRKALTVALNKTGEAITEAYKKQMPVDLAEVRYDAITDHGRNDVPVATAVAQAIGEAALPLSRPMAPTTK
jgi:hypothetical protein